MGLTFTCNFLCIHAVQYPALFHISDRMPLYIIGLGLGDEKDITIKGAEAIKNCDKVFLEAYTSILGVSTAKLVSAKVVRMMIFSGRS